MCPPSLPPEAAQYLGPAFAPVAAGLWAVIGYPLCSLCLLIWIGIGIGGAGHGLAEAIGAVLVAAVLGIVALVAGVLVVACLVGAIVLFGVCGLAAYVSWRRAD